MRIKIIFCATTLVLSLIVMISCQRSEYDRLVKQELDRNIRYDSLFLGLHFGMARKDFFLACWDMNKQGLLQQGGASSLSVQYELDSSEMKSKTYMWFYPEFKNDSISKMPVEFQYVYWTPVFQPLSTDSLMLDVKNLFETWYGGTPFLFVENEDKTVKLWVKVDGNRRIRLFKKNISTVRAEFSDLLSMDTPESTK